MDILKIKDMHIGWFIGNFEPTAYKTKDFEVSYRVHKKDEKWGHHYHKIATEINLLIKGHMKMCDKILKSGDIFIVHPMEIADPIFYEDCEVVCIKMPSITTDKYLVDE